MSKKNIIADFCVIGAGSGGLSFAAGAAQMGASVVLLERGEMGGDCLNSGCVPSKSLIAAAKAGHNITAANKFGWKTTSQLDYKKVHQHVHNVIKTIAPHDSVERFQKLGVNVIQEEGHFLDAKTMETKNHIIKAKRYIIATGSHPFIPPIKGLESVNYLTNETIFDLKELPNHLVIIGGGPIGIEIAQAFGRLGSKVTVLESSAALPKDDPYMTSHLKKIISDEGGNLIENIEIISVAQKGKKIDIFCNKEQEININASHLMVATGRRPNIEHLNLDAAGIKYSNMGIKVNNKLKTTNRRVHAIGDCTGGYQFTHVAGYHAGLAIRNSIFGLGTKVQTHPIPWVTYTDPELAHVGFQETQLKKGNVKYKTLEMSFDEIDRAQAEKRTQGSIKVLVKPNGYILGATILGNQAGELIYPWVMAIQNNLKISAIANSIAPYPTLNDINKRVAGSFYTPKIFSRLMKKIVKILMKFKV